MTTQNEFFNALRVIQGKATRIPLPDVLVIKAWSHTSETTTATQHTPEIEERSVAAQYLCVYANELANPDFDTDLTSWTEDIDAGITATTTHHTTQGETFAEQGAIGSLEVDVTASANIGQASRKQTTITAAAAEVWNFQVWFYGDAFLEDDFTTTQAQIRIIWSGGATAEASSTTLNSWTELKLENQTAPGGTTSVDVYVEIDVTTSGGTGKAWFGKVRAERAAPTTITDRARRIIAGEWVCRDGTETVHEIMGWMQPITQPIGGVAMPQMPQPVPMPVWTP